MPYTYSFADHVTYSQSCTWKAVKSLCIKSLNANLHVHSVDNAHLRVSVDQSWHCSVEESSKKVPPLSVSLVKLQSQAQDLGTSFTLLAEDRAIGRRSRDQHLLSRACVFLMWCSRAMQ